MNWTRKALKAQAAAAYRGSWECCLAAGCLMFISSGMLTHIFRTAKLLYGSIRLLFSGGIWARSLLESVKPGIGSLGAVSPDPDTLMPGMLYSMGILMKSISLSYILGILITAVIGRLISLLIRIFVLQPLEVGCKGFFMADTQGPAPLDCILESLSADYFNIVKVQFVRFLYTTLWGMALVIPGVVKGYEYRLVPYLLNENPHMDAEEALGLSKRMMEGEKWKAFLLDLSFLGWYLLGILTFGLVTGLFVCPYHELANAYLYGLIRERYLAGGQERGA